MADKIATREAYGQALVDLAPTHDFVVFDADLAAATKTGKFKKAYPDRFFDCGIAEGNMMSMAAGFATTGTPVFASTFAIFASGRAYEQVRNSIGYTHLNVKIGATHAGVTVGEDGATHQCNEDFATMRAIPGMTVLSPCDAIETAKCVKAALEMNGPVYMRFGRAPIPNVTTEDTPFVIGKGLELCPGTDCTIIATGIMVHMACEAAEELKAEGISCRVINMGTIKPLDEELVIRAAKETGHIITAEEHSIIGGLGAAVCECVAEQAPCLVKRVGLGDTFGRSGPFPELLEYYGLTKERLVEEVKCILKK